MEESSSSDIKQLLGSHPSSSELLAHISSLAALVSKPEATVSEVRSYPDAVYFNYSPLGLSLLFKPVNGYKPKVGLRREELKEADLIIDGIDVYNGFNPQAGNKPKSTYSAYPVSPLVLVLSTTAEAAGSEQRPATFDVKADTTGKQFVESFGEPDRKGGGAGPSSGSIGIWCEWSKDGVMVEFGGDESRGPQAWERGKDAVWKVITIFPPKTA
ncbi:hypothetical protein AcW1_000725 [Taiwanofungus camphoratus]|nr:hypothetical protein AcW2_000773 [Antrodia cinnamomea]KAI0961721.1 hypothetical protein AcV7_000745 [Antrodia cinnamomea]KAI0963732.1 hypothetical protein AcW1_000725 [Antrodia cinnamomea]